MQIGKVYAGSRRNRFSEKAKDKERSDAMIWMYLEKIW